MILKKETQKDFKVTRENIGVGVVEAPRGTLYHMMGVDKNGKINKSEIVIPTAQNLINMEKDMVAFVNQMLGKGMNKEQISMNAERLIRAYDPCMSCATHFLKINWREK